MSACCIADGDIYCVASIGSYILADSVQDFFFLFLSLLALTFLSCVIPFFSYSIFLTPTLTLILALIMPQGFVWLATRQGDAGVWNQAGGSFATEYGGSWDGGEASESLITPVVDGDEPDGVDDYDKSNVPRNELVLIGLDMDQRALHSALQSCLLSDKEMDAGPAEWARMTDPFPPWQEDEDE